MKELFFLVVLSLVATHNAFIGGGAASNSRYCTSCYSSRSDGKHRRLRKVSIKRLEHRRLLERSVTEIAACIGPVIDGSAWYKVLVATGKEIAVSQSVVAVAEVDEVLCPSRSRNSVIYPGSVLVRCALNSRVYSAIRLCNSFLRDFEGIPKVTVTAEGKGVCFNHPTEVEKSDFAWFYLVKFNIVQADDAEVMGHILGCNAASTLDW